MAHPDGQALDSIESHLLEDKRLQIIRQLQLTQSDLGGYLPTTGGTEEQLVSSIADNPTSMGG